ncbi:hypothetical protein [Prauserella muralis]|uniref:Uncharacterized protein n=1 Tax=Prauserella muralis TaxID=588067 RepID=A0A2V4ALF7_9PSEU|nr:hypothetical protein [Prauserella muralis]PXY21128.1 hypothetical protein BAY60_27055 [Prauserella muralis]TWE30216.1 hypothetical protein FHX69_2913 [Prauserella muralis]
MPRYAVQHRYLAVDNGQQIGPFESGTAVELELDRAEWVNRDSPGALLLLGGVVASSLDAEPEPAAAGSNGDSEGGGDQDPAGDVSDAQGAAESEHAAATEAAPEPEPAEPADEPEPSAPKPRRARRAAR